MVSKFARFELSFCFSLWLWLASFILYLFCFVLLGYTVCILACKSQIKHFYCAFKRWTVFYSHIMIQNLLWEFIYFFCTLLLEALTCYRNQIEKKIIYQIIDYCARERLTMWNPRWHAPTSQSSRNPIRTQNGKFSGRIFVFIQKCHSRCFVSSQFTQWTVYRKCMNGNYCSCALYRTPINAIGIFSTSQFETRWLIW